MAEADWDPPPGPDDLVHVRVAFAEEELRKQVEQAGGRWRPDSKTWEVPLRVVDELGLLGRTWRVFVHLGTTSRNDDPQMYEH